MDDVRIARREAVLEIVLDRRGEGNALTPAMADAVVAATASLDPGVNAVLLRGEGEDFCTGRAPAMPPPGTRATARTLTATVAEPILAFYDAVAAIAVPVVALVQGSAAGVGCALAGLADICIADAGARFSVPEMDRDIAPTLVMHALADRIPRAALARLVLTREPIGAEEARAIGLVSIVAEPGTLNARGDVLLALLARNSGPVVRGVKRMLGFGRPLDGTRREIAALINGAVTAERFQ